MDWKITIFSMLPRSVSAPSLTLVKLTRCRWLMTRPGRVTRSRDKPEQFSIVTRDWLSRMVARPCLDTFLNDFFMGYTRSGSTSEQDRWSCRITSAKCDWCCNAKIVVIIMRSFMMLGEYWQEVETFLILFFHLIIISPCACWYWSTGGLAIFIVELSVQPKICITWI